MVRRIGFGEPDKEDDGIRRKRLQRYKRLTAAPWGARDKGTKPAPTGRFKNPVIPRDASPAGRRRATWIIIGFLALWLAAWTFGLVSAFDAFANSTGGAAIFMAIWLAFAVGGEVIVVFLLLALLFGKDVSKRKSKDKEL